MKIGKPLSLTRLIIFLDDTDALVVLTRFDELYPLKDFDGYFGLRNLKKTYKNKSTIYIQRARVYGNYYDSSCNYVGTFDSGLSNSGLKKRFSQRVTDIKYTSHLATKSGEMNMDAKIGSTTYTLTYTH